MWDYIPPLPQWPRGECVSHVALLRQGQGGPRSMEDPILTPTLNINASVHRTSSLN